MTKVAICNDTTAGGHYGCAALVTMTRDEAGGFCMGWPADALPVRVGPKTENPPLWPRPGADAFARFLVSHDRVVTGRFHAYASSLYNIEATLRDIWLDGQRLPVL